MFGFISFAAGAREKRKTKFAGAVTIKRIKGVTDNSQDFIEGCISDVKRLDFADGRKVPTLNTIHFAQYIALLETQKYLKL